MRRLLLYITLICSALSATALATPAVASAGATHPHLSVNVDTMRYGVGPVGDTAGSSGSGTLRVVVTINGVVVHSSENGGSGIFTGPSAAGDVHEGDIIEATAETLVNGIVVDAKTERIYVPGSGGGGGCAD